MLAIDILRNNLPNNLGVLSGDLLGFGCPKDAQTPCWLSLCLGHVLYVCSTVFKVSASREDA